MDTCWPVTREWTWVVKWMVCNVARSTPSLCRPLMGTVKALTVSQSCLRVVSFLISILLPTRNKPLPPKQQSSQRTVSYYYGHIPWCNSLLRSNLFSHLLPFSTIYCVPVCCGALHFIFLINLPRSLFLWFQLHVLFKVCWTPWTVAPTY